MVTSSHIHLLVVDTEEKIILQSLQLIAGRTAQKFNTRKNRKGSFWEDRYHATAVDTDKYLAKCMVYIDLNMVRAGVVAHPSECRSSGYNEIQNPQSVMASSTGEYCWNIFPCEMKIDCAKSTVAG